MSRSRPDAIPELCSRTQGSEQRASVTIETVEFACRMEVLTPREVQVLRLICEGLSTRAIAARLGISFKTAACHRAHINDKAGVSNSIELFRWALRHGYVTLDGVEPSEAPAPMGVNFTDLYTVEDQLRHEIKQARDRHECAMRQFGIAIEQARQLGWTHPDGANGMHKAMAAYNRAAAEYIDALKRFSMFILGDTGPG